VSLLCSAQGNTINPPADGEADEEVEEDRELATTHLVEAMDRRQANDHEASFHRCFFRMHGDLSQPLSLIVMLISGAGTTMTAHCHAL